MYSISALEPENNLDTGGYPNSDAASDYDKDTDPEAHDNGEHPNSNPAPDFDSDPDSKILKTAL